MLRNIKSIMWIMKYALKFYQKIVKDIECSNLNLNCYNGNAVNKLMKIKL